jgi:predicted site-specific integrase-resolvase
MGLHLSSRKQLAAYFGVTTATVANWEKQGIIRPFCVINGRPRYELQDAIDSITKSREGKSCN